MIHDAFQVSFIYFEKNMNFSACMVISSALCLSLGGLFGMHTYIILKMTSTLEMN